MFRSCNYQHNGRHFIVHHGQTFVHHHNCTKCRCHDGRPTSCHIESQVNCRALIPRPGETPQDCMRGKIRIQHGTNAIVIKLMFLHIRDAPFSNWWSDLGLYLILLCFNVIIIMINIMLSYTTYYRLESATCVDVTMVAWHALTLMSVRMRERKMMRKREGVRGVRMHHRGWSVDETDEPTALDVLLWTVAAWGILTFLMVLAPARSAKKNYYYYVHSIISNH